MKVLESGKVFLLAGFGVAVCVGATVAIGQSPLRALASSSRSQAGIKQPDHWIPISAQYEVRNPATSPYTMAEYVTFDGSRRRDSSWGPHGPLTAIDNISLHMHYESHDGVWTEQPLRAQRYGGKPFERITAGSKLIRHDDPRVRALARKGFTFYEPPGDPAQSIQILCPELNMRVVYEKSAGVERQLTSLTFGEPDIPLTPPSGATVTHFDKPGGQGMATAEEFDMFREFVKTAATTHGAHRKTTK